MTVTDNSERLHSSVLSSTDNSKVISSRNQDKVIISINETGKINTPVATRPDSTEFD